MFEPVVTAIRTLTIVPVPGRDSANPASALPVFPLVGAALGILLYCTATGLSLLFPGRALIGGLLVTAIAILITGALHLDGFADVADAFGCGRRRERILEIRLRDA